MHEHFFLNKPSKLVRESEKEETETEACEAKRPEKGKRPPAKQNMRESGDVRVWLQHQVSTILLAASVS